MSARTRTPAKAGRAAQGGSNTGGGRKKAANPGRGAKAEADPEVWDLRLYVAGTTAKSAAALANLKRLCEENLAGRYRIEVVDLLKEPQLARGDQIVAIPTLVRKLPAPIKKIIGDLSNTERAVVGLDLRAGA